MRSMPKVPPKGFTFGLLLHKHIHSSVGRKKVPMGWQEEKAWKALHRKRGARSGDCLSLTQSSHDIGRNRRSRFQVKRCPFVGRRVTLVGNDMVQMSKFQNLFYEREKGERREMPARRRQIECLRRRRRRRRVTTRSGAVLASACAHWNWHSRGHLSLLALRARDTVFCTCIL